MSEPLNRYIRVASSSAASDLQDWLAYDDAEAGRPEFARAELLIALAREVQPPQVLLLRRVGRTCCGTMRPLVSSHDASQHVGLPFVEIAGPTIDDVVAGLVDALRTVDLARV